MVRPQTAPLSLIDKTHGPGPPSTLGGAERRLLPGIQRLSQIQ